MHTTYFCKQEEVLGTKTSTMSINFRLILNTEIFSYLVRYENTVYNICEIHSRLELNFE